MENVNLSLELSIDIQVDGILLDKRLLAYTIDQFKRLTSEGNLSRPCPPNTSNEATTTLKIIADFMITGTLRAEKVYEGESTIV